MILHCVNFNQWIFMILLNQNLPVSECVYSPLVLRWLVHFNYRQGEVASGTHHLQIRVIPLQSVLGHTAELIGTHINANAYSREIQSYLNFLKNVFFSVICVNNSSFDLPYLFGMGGRRRVQGYCFVVTFLLGIWIFKIIMMVGGGRG